MPPKENLIEALAPPPGILCKLGSIIAHVEELFSDDGHAFDKIALEQLLQDGDVQRWMRVMTVGGYLPVKRRKR